MLESVQWMHVKCSSLFSRWREPNGAADATTDAAEIQAPPSARQGRHSHRGPREAVYSFSMVNDLRMIYDVCELNQLS